MYSRLLSVLYANVAAWFVLTLVVVATQLGFMSFPWELLFIVGSFWDVLYLTVLLAVAWIWAPGPEAFRYAYYAQSAGTEEDGHQHHGGHDGADGDEDGDGTCAESATPTRWSKGWGRGNVQRPSGRECRY